MEKIHFFEKSYPHFKSPIFKKNRVIHGVIHFIHNKFHKIPGLHRTESKHAFCGHVIKIKIM